MKKVKKAIKKVAEVVDTNVVKVEIEDAITPIEVIEKVNEVKPSTLSKIWKVVKKVLIIVQKLGLWKYVSKWYSKVTSTAAVGGLLYLLNTTPASITIQEMQNTIDSLTTVTQQMDKFNEVIVVE